MSPNAPPDPDNRTVLYALPEDQPDDLGVGTVSHPAHAKPIPPGAGKGDTDDDADAPARSAVSHPAHAKPIPPGAGKGDTDDDADAPARSAVKADWETYARSVGVDTEGMTKDDIIEALGR